MSCRDYIGQNLQLPVARSASILVFPGCFFCPEMKNDYAGQSTFQYHELCFLQKPFFLKKKNPPGYCVFYFPSYCRPSIVPIICFFEYKFSLVFKLLLLIFWLDNNAVKIFPNMIGLHPKAEKSICCPAVDGHRMLSKLGGLCSVFWGCFWVPRNIPRS